MAGYRKSQPVFGNASADPTRPLVVPLNRAARQRYGKSRGLDHLPPAINKPILNPKRAERKAKAGA